MLEAGVSRGVETAWLEVRPSNFLARVLYQKAGFKETGRRPQYYKDTNEDAIVMSLSLFKKEVHPSQVDENFSFRVNLQQSGGRVCR